MFSANSRISSNFIFKNLTEGPFKRPTQNRVNSLTHNIVTM